MARLVTATVIRKNTISSHVHCLAYSVSSGHILYGKKNERVLSPVELNSKRLS